MIKISAINSAAKKAALGAMLASSVAMFASNPIKTARTETPQQTEVISKDGAEALKALTFPQEKQTPAVPTVHNQKLDENILKFFDTEEDITNAKNVLNEIYDNNGTYMASLLIQQQIDYNMFLAFLNGDSKIVEKFYSHLAEDLRLDALKIDQNIIDQVMEWLEPNFFLVIQPVIDNFDHPPDANELIQAINKYVNEDPSKFYHIRPRFFDGNFNKGNDYFRKQQEKYNNSNIQKDSDYIAKQIHTADFLLFDELLKYKGGIDVKSRELCSTIGHNFTIFKRCCKPIPSP